MTTLAALLRTETVSRVQLSDHLDGLSQGDRLAQCLVLSPIQQKLLWELTSAAPLAGMELLVSGDGESAVYAGRNSLQFFNRFKKRFTRQGDAVIGYNEHTMRWLVGPGYFTVQQASNSSVLRFDYGKTPSQAPGGWPRVASNSGFLSRPVYGALEDEVVWVSSDVMVGSAFRAGASLNSFFVLVRDLN